MSEVVLPQAIASLAGGTNSGTQHLKLRQRTDEPDREAKGSSEETQMPRALHALSLRALRLVLAVGGQGTTRESDKYTQCSQDREGGEGGGKKGESRETRGGMLDCTEHCIAHSLRIGASRVRTADTKIRC